MITTDISTPEYLPQMVEIIKRYSLNENNIVIVPNTLVWARTNGVYEIDRDVAAFSSHSKNIIVLREKITKNEANGQILERIDFPGIG